MNQATRSPTNPRRLRSSIRRSTDADLEAIFAWLQDEKDQGIPGNFLCNWSLTEESHQDGRLLVYVDGPSQVPVAYQWGGLIRPGILQVRYDMRGKGIGKKLVQRCITNAYKKDECLLYIECKPSSSIPFWQAMGFTLLEDDGGWRNFAYRVLSKTHPLPEDGLPVDVEICFYPEKRKWEKTTAPCCTFAPMATMTANGIVHLSERAFVFEDLYADLGDPLIEITVNGQVRYSNKAKYDEATRVGVRCCRNGFYIDRIYPA